MKEQLRAAAPKGAPVGVDRDKNVLRGYVVAQAGSFKSSGRGEFDQKSLDLILSLGNAAPQGLKSRLNHASMSDDGIGKHLGRARDFVMGTALDARTGKKVPAVRADLHFDRTALDEPIGGGKPIGVYVMDLAESDPDALSSSLVLSTEMEYRLNKDGTAQTDEDGEPLPPLWRPTALYGSDIVDTGDAVDGLLSPTELAEALDVGLTPEQLQKLARFDRPARLGSQILDRFFRKAGKEEIRQRCGAWLERYLSLRFPGVEIVVAPPNPTPRLDARKARMDALLAKQP